MISLHNKIKPTKEINEDRNEIMTGSRSFFRFIYAIEAATSKYEKYIQIWS